MKIKPVEGYILGKKVESKSEGIIITKETASEHLAEVVEAENFKPGEIIVYLEAQEHKDYLLIRESDIIAKVA